MNEDAQKYFIKERRIKPHNNNKYIKEWRQNP
jgi:hypothetical protein